MAKKGEKYECETCGLVVTVDEDCDCEEACDIVCCSAPMKPVKSSSRTSASKSTSKSSSSRTSKK